MNSLSKSETRVSRAPACNVYCLSSTTEQFCNIAVSVKPRWAPNAAKPASMPAPFSTSRRVVIRFPCRVCRRQTPTPSTTSFDIPRDHFSRAGGRVYACATSVPLLLWRAIASHKPWRRAEMGEMVQLRAKDGHVLDAYVVQPGVTAKGGQNIWEGIYGGKA